MPNDYRQSHRGTGYGATYVSTYTRGYYAGQWNSVERPLLEGLFAQVREVGVRDVMDFAAGTGRITQVAARFFPHVTAVDISEDMLAQAPADPNVRRVCQDITVEPLSTQYDLCTAFRFFLNAEQPLRDAALDSISRSLRPAGLLIANIHMSPSSPMGLVYRALAAVGLKSHQVLSANQFRQMLDAHGFDVQQDFAYGYLPRPGGLMPALMEKLAGPAEVAAKRISIPPAFAQSHMFLAKKR